MKCQHMQRIVPWSYGTKIQMHLIDWRRKEGSCCSARYWILRKCREALLLVRGRHKVRNKKCKKANIWPSVQEKVMHYNKKLRKLLQKKFRYDISSFFESENGFNGFKLYGDTPLVLLVWKKMWTNKSSRWSHTKLSVLKGDCQDQSWMIFQLENSPF